MKLITRILCAALVATLPVSAVLEAQSTIAPKFDLLLKGGHVIDPKNGIDKIADVAIAKGHIASVAENLPVSDAKKVVELDGLYVIPGMIDLHVHVFPRYVPSPGKPGNLGVPPDAFSFRSGVTTVVDAGTSGWKEFPEFKRLAVDSSKTRVLSFLNIVSAGMETGNDDNVPEMDAEGAARMAKQYPDIIVGIKSAHYAGSGWPSVDNAVKAGNIAHIPVMVDFGYLKGERSIGALFQEHLRPGDIYTHCFSGHREEVLANDELNPAMVEGRKKGIIFDVGFGGGSFYWYVADSAYKAHFYPDSISTDLHTGSMNAGMKTMANVASELMALGSSIQDVVKMSTWAPAQEIHRPELGNLDVGAEADIAVIRVETGHFGFLDSTGARHTGTSRLVPELTLRKGDVVWDLDGIASQDWRSFPYKKDTNDPYRK